MDKNLRALIKYLEICKINIDVDEFQYQLLGHPNYPSILSFSDTLNFFNINNSVYEIIKSQILFLPNLFLSVKEGSFKLEKKLDFKITNEKDSEVVLVIDSENYLISPIQKLNNSIIGYTISSLLLIFILFLNKSYFLINLSFVIFLLAGFFLSLEAYKKTHGNGTLIPTGVCKNKFLKTDCDFVFNSKKWKIFEIFDLSIISILFFLTQFFSFLGLALYKDLNSFYIVFSYILYLFIPISFLSFFYQIFIVKKLCPVCIGIIFLVYIQGFSIIYFLNLDKSLNLYSFIFVFICAGISFFLFNYIKGEKDLQKKLKEDNISNSIFRKNFVFFKNNLQIQKKQLIALF